jgi:hypothetical protein
VWEPAEVRQLWRTTEQLTSAAAEHTQHSEQWLSEVQHQCCFALQQAQRMVESVHGAYIGNTDDLDRIAALQQEVVQVKLEIEHEEAAGNGTGEQQRARLRALDARWEECQKQERALTLKIARAQRNNSEQTTQVAGPGTSESKLRKQLEELQAKLDAVSAGSDYRFGHACEGLPD